MPGYVGFWQRLLAFLIDSMVVFVVYGPLVVMTFGTEYFSLDVPRYWDAATGLVIAVGTLLFWRYEGATPGKIAIAAKIVDAETGKPPSTARLGVRLLAYMFRRCRCTSVSCGSRSTGASRAGTIRLQA